jgi:hypothetical protein
VTELPLLPLLFVGLGVEEVDPLFPALDFRSVIALFPEFSCNMLPLFGFKLGFELSEEFEFLNSRKLTSEDQSILPLLQDVIM